MVLGGRGRTAAWLAAGILFVGAGAAGCGDDDEGAEEPSPTQTTATESPAGNRPADPAAAEKQVRENWATFFDPRAPLDEKTKVLENGDRLEQVLQAFSGDQRAQQVAAEVTKVTFTSATGAEVTYNLTVKGATVQPNVSGVAVLQDNVWKVSVKTLCALVGQSGVEAPGC